MIFDLSLIEINFVQNLLKISVNQRGVLQPVKKKKKKSQKNNMEVDQPPKTDTGVEKMEVDT